MAFSPRNVTTNDPQPHEPVTRPPAPPALAVPDNQDAIFLPDPRPDQIAHAVKAAVKGQPLALLRLLAGESDVYTALNVHGVFNDLTTAAIVLGNARTVTLERPESWVGTVGRPVPLWWRAFRTTDAPSDHLFSVLCLLRAHGVDMRGTPYTHNGGDLYGEVLRAFLRAEHADAIEQQKVDLCTIADAAVAEAGRAEPTRRRARL